MNQQQVAAMTLEVVGQQLLQARLRGIEFGFVVDGDPRFLPAGTVRAEAQRQASLAGAELLSLDTEDGLRRIASALARATLEGATVEMGQLLAGRGAKA